MDSNSRKLYVAKNVIAKWASTILLTLIQLISRRIFIGYYSDSLLGLSGLLQSVISMLSLLELGVGSAIYYSLYEPLANNNQKQINAIMRLYKKIYAGIGVAVLCVGILIIPFLDILVETEVSNQTVTISYYILLADTVLSYFLAYSRNIFNADQKEFFCTNCDTISHVGAGISQILVTIITGNYYLYLGIKVIWTISANWYIHFQSLRKYKFIRKKTDYKLDDHFKKKFIGNVKALCVSNLSTYLVFGTDNLLLSTFIDLASVFIYSNYSTIITTVNKLFNNLFISTQASVGNYMVTEGKEKSYILFKNMFFINYVITSFTSIALLAALNPFITLWLGEEYTWPLVIEALLVFNNLQRFILQTVSVFRNAAGIYNPYRFYKYWGFIEGGVNLTFSVAFVYIFIENPIIGIFLGTTVSTVVTSLVQPHALFKYYFGAQYLRSYFAKYLMYMLLSIINAGIVYWLCNMIVLDNHLVQCFINSIISVVFFMMTTIIIFRKTSEYKYFTNIMLAKIKRKV